MYGVLCVDFVANSDQLGYHTLDVFVRGLFTKVLRNFQHTTLSVINNWHHFVRVLKSIVHLPWCWSGIYFWPWQATLAERQWWPVLWCILVYRWVSLTKWTFARWCQTFQLITPWLSSHWPLTLWRCDGARCWHDFWKTCVNSIQNMSGKSSDSDLYYMSLLLWWLENWGWCRLGNWNPIECGSFESWTQSHHNYY